MTIAGGEENEQQILRSYSHVGSKWQSGFAGIERIIYNHHPQGRSREGFHHDY
jgi:hypothetical protein